MQRILVLGPSGAGKSTLASRLGEITTLPVIHIDQLYWSSGWEPVPTELYLERLTRAVAQDRWIIDGISIATLDIRLPRADLVILLDRSRTACVWRIARRVWGSYGAVRPDMAPGCPERFDWEFAKFAWSFRSKHWPQLHAAIDRHRAWDRTTTLKSDAESAAFLRSLQAGAPAG